jgi:signal transduction histidine kinase
MKTMEGVSIDMNRPAMTHRRLLLFKWLMVFIPPVTVAVGHSRLLGHTLGDRLLGYRVGGPVETLLVPVLVTFLALVLAYIFVEALFRVLRRLQAEALAREQDILTMNAVMQERERLSRELHDGVAQLVAHLLLRLDTIKELVEEDRQPEAEAELERLHGVAGEIYEDVGESITGLRSNVTERGLIRALQDYVDQFEERHQIPVSLRTDDAADQLSPLAAFQLFRLIQEALTNVRKHAGAREATVTLTSDGPDQLRVVVADDGRGFAPASQRNGTARPLGLTSMRERVEALGGTFHVKSQPGSGTQVTATIPIPRTRRENGHAALAASPS